MLKNVRIIKITSFLWGLSFYVPIVSLFYLDNGVSLSAIVISQVFFAIFSFLGEVPTGVFADKVGQKPAVMIGFGLGALAFVLMLLFPTTIMLFVVYSLRGLANAFLSGSTEAILYESDRENFKKNSGQMLGYMTLASAIGAAVTAAVLAFAGTKAYQISIILTLFANIVCLILAVLIYDGHEKIRIQSKGQKAFSMAIDGLKTVKQEKMIWALTLVGVLTLSGEYFLYSVYQPYFQQNNVSAFWLGLVMSIGAILNFVVLKYVYLLEKYLPLPKIITVINLSIALGYLAMALLVNPVFLVVGFILTKGMFNAELPIVNDFIHERVESHMRATIASGISFFQSLFQVLARIVLGLLVASIGIGNTMLVQAIYIVIGISIGYWLMVRCGCVHRIHKHFTDTDLTKAL